MPDVHIWHNNHSSYCVYFSQDFTCFKSAADIGYFRIKNKDEVLEKLQEITDE